MPRVPAPPGPRVAAKLATIAPIARSSVVEAVSGRLRDEILSGRLPPGSRLPAERELAVALGVNRLSLRASLARLEAQGLVTTRHGTGTVVASWQERASLDALVTVAGTMRPTDPAWRELLTAVLEVRRILASEAVGLAAERHLPEDLERLARLARAQADLIADPIAFARGEVAFERAIVRAAKNVGLELILNSFARFPDEQPALVALLYDRTELATAFYPVIIDLIARGDGPRARATMRAALERVDEDWQSRHFGPGEKPRPRPKTPKKRSVRR